jgi:uncharacterized membrane protein
MNITHVLAQMLGIIFLIVGLSAVVNKKLVTMVVEEITRNQGLWWISGFITLMMGAVLVVLNNVWSSGLQLFITIISWLALIKGTFILVFPNSSVSFYRKLGRGNAFLFSGIIGIIVGLILLYKGLM